jgi:hypothetical protein
MDKTSVVETLALCEKNNSIVTIKVVNTDKPIVGAVQKVLNQVIILKSAASEPITLTFADIESINGSVEPFFKRVFTLSQKHYTRVPAESPSKAKSALIILH